MPRRGDDLYCRVAERQLIALRTHGYVASRHPAGGSGRPLQRRLPVCRTHHDLCAEPLLQFRCPLIVITVCVADDDVLDLTRVEPELRHPVDDFGPRGPSEIRVEDDEAVARLQSPRRVLPRPEANRVHKVEEPA